jgi:hypothetical protein
MSKDQAKKLGSVDPGEALAAVRSNRITFLRLPNKMKIWVPFDCGIKDE